MKMTEMEKEIAETIIQAVRKEMKNKVPKQVHFFIDPWASKTGADMFIWHAETGTSWSFTKKVKRKPRKR